ncbi:hypothetical protein [Marinobacterium sp. BA1]|uniref:hypothetical protein n=1 Tax=Marinobacterium sp. BA1 TaxID=3138931 RepID=UPI0032E74FE5
MTKSKAIYAGVFTGVFAGLIVHLLFSLIGIEVLQTAPFIIGFALGGQVMSRLLERCRETEASKEGVHD